MSARKLLSQWFSVSFSYAEEDEKALSKDEILCFRKVVKSKTLIECQQGSFFLSEPHLISVVLSVIFLHRGQMRRHREAQSRIEIFEDNRKNN